MEIPGGSVSWWDEYISAVNAAIGVFVASVLSVGATYFSTRSKNSKLQVQMASNQADIKETLQKSGFLERVVIERDQLQLRLETLRTEMQEKLDAMQGKLEAAAEIRLEDARQITRLETERRLDSARIEELEQEHSEVLALAQDRAQKMGACEEKMVILRDENLGLRMHAEKLAIALAKANPDMADRILEERWNTPKIVGNAEPEAGK